MTDTRPEWLRSYVLVSGRIPSAPLDLPGRMQSVYARLQNGGWRVAVKSIGTDFSGPLGLPIPKEQPIELYLYHPKYRSAEDAADALAASLRLNNLDYSPIGAWLGEIVDHVVTPTIRDVGKAQNKATNTMLWWVAGGLAAFVLVARATAPAADSYARLSQSLRR